MEIKYTENDTQGGEPLIQMNWSERSMIMEALKKSIANCSDDPILEQELLREFEQIDVTVRANRVAFLRQRCSTD